MREPPVLRVRIVKDDASPLYAIKCADACGSCGRDGCWLSSALTRAGAARIAAEKNWQVVG